MNNKVKIKVLCDSNYFIKYLINNSIKYESLERKGSYYYLNINNTDYKRIKYRFETKVIKYYGINYIKNFIIYNKYFIISFLICLFLLNLLCNTIYQIDINTSNENLKNSIENALKKYDISIIKRKTNREKLNIIKDNIIKEIPNLEWIEINENGCNYEINIIEKKNTNNKIDNIYSDIVASKDGLIKHIVVHNGTKVKEENEYVKKGEIIVSGNLSYNDTTIKNTNSKAEIYAEVWYKSSISVPLNYTEYIKTNKKINRYYVEIFNKEFIITGKYEPKYILKEKKCILNKPYLFFKLYKEIIYEYKYNKVKLNKKDAYNIGIRKSDDYINNLLETNEYIISKKVLNYKENSSKIEIDIFYKVYENIAQTLYN